jgi:phosphoribosylaminoimidazolecarboxamide formyltransferase/IMP cyclohydrolase
MTDPQTEPYAAPKRALVSVTDKTGLDMLAPALAAAGVELISTGGTARTLTDLGLPVTPIEDVTGNPEAFSGRMKTISFQIGAGLLYKRSDASHAQQAKTLGVPNIDLVVCNLYRFEAAAEDGLEGRDLIEHIDIGGPTMIRAAAKNHQEGVFVLTHPDQYGRFTQHLQAGTLNSEVAAELAADAFTLTARYDAAIAERLTGGRFKSLPLEGGEALRYGENPHQDARVHRLANTAAPGLLDATRHQGKPLSFNNLIDADAAHKAAWDARHATGLPAAAVIKHANPAGLAAAPGQAAALASAWAGDPVSAFGSVIALTEPAGDEIATWLEGRFVEVLIAPSFTPAALEALAMRKNLRVLAWPERPQGVSETVYKSVAGALIVQDEDSLGGETLEVVTHTALTGAQAALAPFGIAAAKHLRSNAVALVSPRDAADPAAGAWLTGAGMGQPNRLDALARLTMPRFGEKDGVRIEDAVLISDAFFPFRDSVDAAASHGIRAIVQPGGSIRDDEVIAACNEHGIAMAFTCRRHFRH